MAQEKQDNFDPLYSPQSNGNGDRYRKFADILDASKGKYVELYIGDQFHTLSYDEISRPENSTIYGKIVEVLDRFVVIDCFYIHKQTGELSAGNLCFINTFQIRAMSMIDNTGSLDDIFLCATHVSKVKKAILQYKAKTGSK